jgi:DNA-directed RNA polymerase specialized sigma24 family protein
MEANNYRGDACGRIQSGKIKPDCKHHTPMIDGRFSSKQPRRGMYVRLEETRRELFKKKARNGMTVHEVSLITGIETKRVYALAKRYKVKLGRAAKIKIEDIKRLAEQNLSKAEIAARLGTTANNINMRAKKAGITIVNWS